MSHLSLSVKSTKGSVRVSSTGGGEKGSSENAETQELNLLAIFTWKRMDDRNRPHCFLSECVGGGRADTRRGRGVVTVYHRIWIMQQGRTMEAFWTVDKNECGYVRSSNPDTSWN